MIYDCQFMQRYVITLDLAHAVYFAGWESGSIFSWYSHEHMAGKWKLGFVKNDGGLFIRPALTVEELASAFPRGSLKVLSNKSNFVAVYGEIVRKEKYRMVDALAELWLECVRKNIF